MFLQEDIWLEEQLNLGSSVEEENRSGRRTREIRMDWKDAWLVYPHYWRKQFRPMFQFD